MKTLYESILNKSGVGKIYSIQKWLDEYEVKNYTINNKGEIDVDGDVNLMRKGLTEFPSFIQFGTIKGNFDCSYNNLTYLKGAPKKVSGIFDCRYNNLESLEGAPKKVGKYFNCSNNELTSLKGAPEKVKEYFHCSFNNLTTLEGAPKKVGDDFYCRYNHLTSLEGAPKVVRGRFVCLHNKTQFTEEDVKKVCKVGKDIIA